jgi:hypothetical protein
VEPLEIGLQHDLAAADAGPIEAALFGHCRLLSWITRAPWRKVMTVFGHRFTAAR